jgi:hypothetical protein
VVITIDCPAKTLTFAPAGSLSSLKKEATAVFPIQLDEERGVSTDIFCRVRVNNTLSLQFCLDSGPGKDVFRINQAFMQALKIDTADTVIEKVGKRHKKRNHQVQ